MTLTYARGISAQIVGVVGRDAGFAAMPHAEAFQAVIWHLLVSHPLTETTWESTQ